MKLVELKLGVVRLPADIEIPLYLIREGLKAQKLFNDLANVGFDESRFYTDFSDAVLKAVGFTELTDELLGWYLDLMEKIRERPGGRQRRVHTRSVSGLHGCIDRAAQT